jgi:2-polyprenyl-3-methyl-5-hydroxy-6-metoxy-1,4-benzoquinol methylase
MTSIPLPSAIFDLVFCTEVLEHIENDTAAVSELRRVMRPGGWLLLSTPTPPAEFDPMHVREGYTAATLAQMLGAEGLEVVRVEFCMYAIYRRILKAFQRRTRLPLHLVKLAAYLDRYSRWGVPMDLLVAARLPNIVRSS